MYKYHYIIDSKLIFYGAMQTGSDVLDTFNRMANILYDLPKGKVYIVSDIGKSAHRLNISPYYKGKRREEKAKQSAEDKLKYITFSQEYLAFVKLCDKLPVTNMRVTDVEADDIASILSEELAQDSSNRIALITRDRDWLHSVIDRPNVKIVSPYYSEDDMNYKVAKEQYCVRNREEFTLRKTLEGDDGDSILHLKWLGKIKVNEIWGQCLKHSALSLDILKDTTFDWINSQSNPGKYSIPSKYIEYAVCDTIDDMFDINYRLAGTMMSRDQLTEKQQKEFQESLDRTSDKCTLHPIEDGLAIFGRPIILDYIAQRVFKCAS